MNKINVKKCLLAGYPPKCWRALEDRMIELRGSAVMEFRTSSLP
jgi:hypothetical protein